jgi:hypothetical protein
VSRSPTSGLEKGLLWMRKAVVSSYRAVHIRAHPLCVSANTNTVKD